MRSDFPSRVSRAERRRAEAGGPRPEERTAALTLARRGAARGSKTRRAYSASGRFLIVHVGRVDRTEQWRYRHEASLHVDNSPADSHLPFSIKRTTRCDERVHALAQTRESACDRYRRARFVARTFPTGRTCDNSAPSFDNISRIVRYIYYFSSYDPLDTLTANAVLPRVFTSSRGNFRY